MRKWIKSDVFWLWYLVVLMICFNEDEKKHLEYTCVFYALIEFIVNKNIYMAPEYLHGTEEPDK